jgi:hypothetical protein
MDHKRPVKRDENPPIPTSRYRRKASFLRPKSNITVPEDTISVLSLQQSKRRIISHDPRPLPSGISQLHRNQLRGQPCSCDFNTRSSWIQVTGWDKLLFGLVCDAFE